MKIGHYIFISCSLIFLGCQDETANIPFSNDSVMENILDIEDSIENISLDKYQEIADTLNSFKTNSPSKFAKKNKNKTNNSVKVKLAETEVIEDSTSLNNSQQEDALLDLQSTEGNSLTLIEVNPINLKEEYSTGQKHSLSLEVKNLGLKEVSLNVETVLPSGWELLSTSNPFSLEQNKTKLVVISVFIPKNIPPGISSIRLNFNNDLSQLIKKIDLKVAIAKNYNLQVTNLSTPLTVDAGQDIISVFSIKNKGNVSQEIKLRSDSEILDNPILIIKPDSVLIVRLKQPTDKKVYFKKNISSSITVTNNQGDLLRAYGKTQIFPNKNQRKDPYFRYPIMASLNYNSYTYHKDHFSTITAELRGDGYLGEKKINYLNFIIRVPKQQKLKRFGITDQYSLTYRYKDKTSIYLGDHSHYFNRLGFDNRYGLGARIEQSLGKFWISTFFTKPRLYNFNSAPLYGLQVKYAMTDSLQVGVSIARSKGTEQGVNIDISENLDEVGQILTADLKYRNKGTFIEAESSYSFTNLTSDNAQYVSFLQRIGKFSYNGSFTIAGKNYFGLLSNSLQYSNNINYRGNKWSVAIGQAVSKVNKRLDPLFFAAEPYFESYYIRAGYKINKFQSLNFRLEKRSREDKLEPKAYNYEETGLNYRYLYNKSNLSLSLNGRIGRTKNKLSPDQDYRTTSSHSIGSSWRMTNSFTMRGRFYHNYTNRYGTINKNSHYYRYNLGFNYNLKSSFKVSATYNSGFSPEENYLKRDFISLGLRYKASRNHQLEIQGSLFENAGVLKKKELILRARYTYVFGVPLKKILEQGALMGRFSCEDKTINLKGIEITAGGKTLVTNSKGTFDINNMDIGINTVFVDKNTLPSGYITKQPAPFQILIEANKNSKQQIELVKASSIKGKLEIPGDTLTRVKGFIVMKNDQFLYSMESDANGNFDLKDINPGTYTLNFLNIKTKQELAPDQKGLKIVIKEGEALTVAIPLRLKTKEIKFINRSYKLGQL